MMEGPMIKPDIAALGVQQRILLFCLASRSDWKQAGGYSQDPARIHLFY
jgi:hypothetical protein